MDSIGFLSRNALQILIDLLADQGYRVIGPTVRDGAIQYLDIEDAAQLPQGISEQQAPGHYRLNHNESTRCFAWANGPQALKPYLFEARETLWRAERNAAGELSFNAEQAAQSPVAVIGARACDLAALALTDRHFLDNIRDPYYAARRDGLFIVAVHCSHPADTCFCASTGDGPRAESGFDLALSELDEGYLVQAGSAAGRRIAAQLSLGEASAEQREQADHEVHRAASQQRALPPGNLNAALFARLDHPRWEQVAERCLTCGNCTSVCPSCFCHRELDVPALGGDTSEHVREWDSCFTEGHSYLHGFVVRPETRHRYRQWLTHKLGSWHEQYGRSGCVGCGRCITWCPVGIDITEEAQAICVDREDTGDAS